jgi:hypothetical protein
LAATKPAINATVWVVANILPEFMSPAKTDLQSPRPFSFRWSYSYQGSTLLAVIPNTLGTIFLELLILSGIDSFGFGLGLCLVAANMTNNY